MTTLEPLKEIAAAPERYGQGARAAYLALAVTIGILLGVGLLTLHQRSHFMERGAEVQPALQSWLVVASQDYSTQSNAVTLAEGTSFAIKVQSAFDGKLAIVAVDRSGQHQSPPLWVADVKGGKAVISPGMHLSGARGEEVMELELHGSSGQTLRSEVRFWHA